MGESPIVQDARDFIPGVFVHVDPSQFPEGVLQTVVVQLHDQSLPQHTTMGQEHRTQRCQGLQPQEPFRDLAFILRNQIQSPPLEIDREAQPRFPALGSMLGMLETERRHDLKILRRDESRIRNSDVLEELWILHPEQSGRESVHPDVWNQTDLAEVHCTTASTQAPDPTMLGLKTERLFPVPGTLDRLLLLDTVLIVASEIHTPVRTVVHVHDVGQGFMLRDLGFVAFEFGFHLPPGGEFVQRRRTTGGQGRMGGGKGSRR